MSFLALNCGLQRAELPFTLGDDVLNMEQYTILLGGWTSQKISNAMTFMFLKEVIGFNVTLSYWTGAWGGEDYEMQARVTHLKFRLVV